MPFCFGSRGVVSSNLTTPTITVGSGSWHEQSGRKPALSGAEGTEGSGDPWNAAAA